jgi:MFS family permease
VSRVWRTWAVLVLFALGTSLITPLIPLYQEELGFGDTVVTLFLGCYVITLVPSMLSLGQLSDRIGRKRVLLIAIATLALAQAILITEPPLAGLLAARAIQGLATGPSSAPAPPSWSTPRRWAGAASCRCWARSRSASAWGPGRGSAA